MRRLVITLIAAATIGGCSGNLTAPMSCDGNPKCKPDTQPSAPNELTLTSSAPVTSSGQLRVSKPQAVRDHTH
jgi:hypothetical protein